MPRSAPNFVQSRIIEPLGLTEGRAAVGVPADERVLGLIHLGPPRQDKEAPERLAPGDYVTFLP